MGMPTDPDGFPIDVNRARLDNKDGTFSTERTMGVEFDGRHYNIPRIVQGRPVSKAEAITDAKHQMSLGWVYPNYSTQEAADAAAPRRSDVIQVERDKAGVDMGAYSKTARKVSKAAKSREGQTASAAVAGAVAGGAFFGPAGAGFGGILGAHFGQKEHDKHVGKMMGKANKIAADHYRRKASKLNDLP
jgi:hypothetical protein